MDDFVYEINNLIVRLDGMKKRLKQDNSMEGTVFNSDTESVKLWRHLEQAARSYIEARGNEVSAGEIIYVTAAFLKWHLEKVLREYYNEQK